MLETLVKVRDSFAMQMPFLKIKDGEGAQLDG